MNNYYLYQHIRLDKNSLREISMLTGKSVNTIRKVKKIFEGAAVDKRYSIMDPVEVFTKTSFAERNTIYVREVIDYC